MNPQSASALVWAAVGGIFLSLVIMSPEGRFLSCVVAGVLAIAPTLFGPLVPRVAGGATLAVAIALAYQGYPAFQKASEDYRKRAEAQPVQTPAQPPAQPPAQQQGNK